MNYYYEYAYNGVDLGRFWALFGAWYLLAIAVSVLSIIAYWKIYTKAGEEGWASLVPFYNLYVLYKITWGNGWYFLLLLIPLANFVITIITQVKLAKAFGKGGGFACGLIFLNTIFIMIMGFSKDIHYVGVDGIGYTPPSAGGGYQNPYNAPYQGSDPYSNAYNQSNAAGHQPPQPQAYTQSSAQNPNYHYQRSEPVTPPQPEPAAAPQASSAAFCSSCGAKVEDGAKFCAVCGKQL